MKEFLSGDIQESSVMLVIHSSFRMEIGWILQNIHLEPSNCSQDIPRTSLYKYVAM